MRVRSRRSRGSDKFASNENGLARFWLFEAVPVDGCGDVDGRDFEHRDGDRVPERHEMDH